MKIEIKRKEFLSVLQNVGIFAGKSKIVPILDNILISFREGGVRTISFDGENGMSIFMPMDYNGGDLDICVSAKQIVNYLKLVKDDTVTMEYDDKKSSLILSHSKGVSEMQTEDGSLFPSIDFEEAGKSMTISGGVLRQWILQGRDFLGSDDINVVMANLYIIANGKIAEVCATNAKILFNDSLELNEEVAENMSVFIGKQSFSAILSVFSDMSSIRITACDNKMFFHSGNVSIVSRPPIGNYPNFKAIIPKEYAMEIEVSKSELLDSLSRVELSANAGTSLVKMSVKEGNITLMAEDMDTGKRASECISCNGDGMINIAFNSTGLKTAISSMVSNNIKLRFITPQRPLFVVDSEIKSLCALVMPMQIG